MYYQKNDKGESLNSKLASKEEKATMRMQFTKLTFVVSTFRMSHTSRQLTILAEYSKNKSTEENQV